MKNTLYLFMLVFPHHSRFEVVVTVAVLAPPAAFELVCCHSTGQSV